MQLSPVVPRPASRLVPGLLALAVVSAACDQPLESPRAAAAGAALSAGTAGTAQAQVLPGETDLWKFAQEVPGFAGVSIDDNGDVVVQVTDMAHASRARGAVAGILPHLRGRGVRVRAARHKFTDLAVWRDAAEAMLDETGWARSLDLDEARNVVRIEAWNNQMRGEIMREAHRRGIPGDGLLVSIASDDGGSEAGEAYQEVPYYSVAPAGPTMLDGRFTTLIGGIAAGRRGSSGSQRNCNIGFIADLSGVRTFITTSSCSATSWAYDGGVWYQPYPDPYSEQYRVGAEYRDKRGESCGFMSPNVCRYSDATAIAIDAGVASERGRIARTLNSEATVPGSKQIDPNNPYFRITSTANPVGGQEVQKMGRATGWTRGPVIITCEVMWARGRTWSKMRCQYRVNAGAELGDSGSPVFVDNGDGTAKLLGMLWGYDQGLHYVYGQAYVVSYVFSPFSGIQTDLGTLTVTAPSTYTPPPPGGGGGGGCTSGGLGCEEMT